MSKERNYFVRVTNDDGTEIWRGNWKFSMPTSDEIINNVKKWRDIYHDDHMKDHNELIDIRDVLDNLLEEIEEMREEEIDVYKKTGGNSCAIRLLCLYEVRDLIKKKLEEEL